MVIDGTKGPTGADNKYNQFLADNQPYLAEHLSGAYNNHNLSNPPANLKVDVDQAYILYTNDPEHWKLHFENYLDAKVNPSGTAHLQTSAYSFGHQQTAYGAAQPSTNIDNQDRHRNIVPDYSYSSSNGKSSSLK